MWRGRQAWLSVATCVLLQSGALFAQSVFRQGGEFQVNRTTVNNQYDPSVAVDADGDFVVVWTDAIHETNRGILGLRFNSAGAVLANEFRVNTYTANSQHRAVVAAAWVAAPASAALLRRRWMRSPRRMAAMDSAPRPVALTDH